MFGQKKTGHSYADQKIRYKKAPKRYRSKTSRSLKSFYTRGYKKPKQARVDTYKFKAPREKIKPKKQSSDHINFKIPHEKMKAKKPPKNFTINDMSRKARKSLYTHQVKKPQSDQTSIHFKATHGIGALYKGNATNDKVRKNDPQTKAHRHAQRYHLFYMITLGIAVLGIILSVFYKARVSAVLFILLLLISLYGSYIYTDNN